MLRRVVQLVLVSVAAMTAAVKRLPVLRPIVAITIDGLLTKLSRNRLRHTIPEPLPGAVEFTRRLGTVAHVMIYTSRANVTINPDRPDEPQLEAAREQLKGWLDAHGFWYDSVWVGQGKPVASLFVGPREVATPLNPDPDDYIAIENMIRSKLDG